MRKNNVILVMGLVGFVGVLSGCATTDNSLYYWGNYSTTLYNYTKEPSSKTRAAHKKELLSIVGYSERHHKKAPPGIYAELGHLALSSDNKSEADLYFQREIENYPESEKVIQLAKQKVSQ